MIDEKGVATSHLAGPHDPRRSGGALLNRNTRMTRGNDVGAIIEASCECGYNERMFLGGGFQDFTERNAFPYLCKECSDIVVLNAMDPEPCCHQCHGTAVTSYSDPSMFLDQPLGRSVHQWGECPSSAILHAKSADAFVDATLQTYDDNCDIDKLLSEMGTDRLSFSNELIAEYQTTWKKIRAGEYYTLYDCGYPCPKCKRKTLHFESAGRWD